MRRRGQPRARPVVSGAIAAVVLLGAMVAVMLSGVPGGPMISLPWNHIMTLHVQLANADGLASHASVDIAGVKVGEVYTVASQGDLSLVTLNISSNGGDIHRDAQILLRPHGLFGPKYVEINPGTKAAPVISDGDTINVTHTVQPVDLDQVLQALQAPEAQNLRTALVELGKASAGRGDDVNHLLNAANTLTASLQEPLANLDSVSGNFSDFIVQNESFNASFAQAPLDQLVANSNRTLAIFAKNATQLGSLLDHADQSLTQLDAALSGEGGSINQTINILGRTNGTIDKLDKFNGLIGLFAANLTGKEAAPGATKSDVTKGIIDAIENIKSAFSSYDCAVSVSPCPEASKEYYLRVQVFNLGGSAQTTQMLQQLICGMVLPNLPLPIPCPTLPASYGSRPGSDVIAGEYTPLVSMLSS